jgi:hypothetical protein
MELTLFDTRHGSAIGVGYGFASLSLHAAGPSAACGPGWDRIETHPGDRSEVWAHGVRPTGFPVAETVVDGPIASARCAGERGERDEA